MKRKTVLTALLSVTALISTLLSSCITTPVSIPESNTPLAGKKISENLGKAEGSSSYAFSVLGFWMIGRPDIEEAVNNAIQSKKGDALINVRCYQTYLWFVLIGLTDVTVEGEAVKFEAIKNEKVK